MQCQRLILGEKNVRVENWTEAVPDRTAGASCWRTHCNVCGGADRMYEPSVRIEMIPAASVQGRGP